IDCTPIGWPQPYRSARLAKGGERAGCPPESEPVHHLVILLTPASRARRPPRRRPNPAAALEAAPIIAKFGSWALRGAAPFNVETVPPDWLAYGDVIALEHALAADPLDLQMLGMVPPRSKFRLGAELDQ